MSGNGVHQEMMILFLEFMYTYNVEGNLNIQMENHYIEFAAVEAWIFVI